MSLFSLPISNEMDFISGNQSEKKINIPWIINVELTNVCNLECLFCDHPVLKNTMEVKEMDDLVFSKIFSDFHGESENSRIYELGLVGLGEPTLDRKLKWHLQVVNENANQFERISFNSNLVKLGVELADLLLSSSINSFTFSVNASNRDKYLRLMRKDRFDVVIKNLKNFISILKKRNKRVYIGVQIIDTEQNDLQEIKSVIPEAEEMGVNFFLRKVYFKPVLQKESTLVNVHTPNEKRRYPCWDIYSRVYIDVNGNFYPCTIGNDSYRETSALCVGNIRNNTILELFNSSKMRDTRDSFEKGEVPFPECCNCNIWALTPNNFSWDEKAQRWLKNEKQIRAYGLKD